MGAIAKAELESRISDLIAAERRSSERALRLEEQLLSERTARGTTPNADIAAEYQERISQLSEEHQSQIHRYEAQIAELTAAEQRAACLNEQRDAAEKRNEEHAAWLTQQLRAEKRSYEDQLAKLRAAEKRNEDRILLLMQ